MNNRTLIGLVLCLSIVGFASPKKGSGYKPKEEVKIEAQKAVMEEAPKVEMKEETTVKKMSYKDDEAFLKKGLKSKKDLKARTKMLKNAPADVKTNWEKVAKEANEIRKEKKAAKDTAKIAELTEKHEAKLEELHDIWMANKVEEKK
jgi:putative cell wall-binding protein